MNKLQFTSFLLIILVFCGYRNKKNKKKTKQKIIFVIKNKLGDLKQQKFILSQF